MQKSHQTKRKFHLAGIIPVEVQSLGFNLPWSDALVPIAPDYLAVERAVYECAFAGCETIWLVCSRETTPLIRHRLGDWIYDPLVKPQIYTTNKVWAPNRRYKQIPIFYVPIHPRDKMKRTGMAWSIIHGYRRAYDISRKFSRWTAPGKYYVAFPHGVYSPHQLQDKRILISTDTNTFLTFNDKTAKEGEMLAFTFGSDDYKNLWKAFSEESRILFRSGIWKDGKLEGEMLPREQRYSGKFIKIETLLKYLQKDNSHIVPVKWYHDISSWDKYCKFLGSKEREYLKKPKATLVYHEYNPIGEDIENDEENDILDDEIDNLEFP